MDASMEARAEVSLVTGPSLHGGIWSQVGYDILDRQGRIIRSWAGPSRSFMRNFGKFVRGMLLVPNDGNELYQDDGGANKAYHIVDGGGTITAGVVAAVGEIALGSSDAAVASDQYNLSGTTHVSQAVVTTNLITSDAMFKWKHEIAFLSGAPTIDVKEIGLFARLRQGDLSAQNNRVMMMRDVIAPTVTVLSGETVVGRYTFTAAI